MPKHLHLIYGEDPFLVEDYVQQLRRKLTEYTHETLPPETSQETFQQTISMLDLFSPKRLLIWKDPACLHNTLSPEEVTTWTTLFKETLQGPTILIIWAQKRPDMRKKLCSTLKQLAETKECPAFKDWEQNKVIAWLRQRTQEMGKQTSEEALETMVQTMGFQLQVLTQFLETVCTFIGNRNKIETADVIAVSGGTSTTLYQLTEALKIRQKRDTLKALSRLLDQGEEPLRLMGFLIATFRLYLQLLLLTEQKKSVQQIGQLLGKNPYFLQRLLESVQRTYPITDLQKALHLLSELDLAIKSGRIKPRLGLELTIGKIILP